MENTVIAQIERIALQAGLPEGRVKDLSRTDNITLPRPRIEFEILPETYERTGRKIGITRTKSSRTVKKELYEGSFDATVNVLAEDSVWLDTFCDDFVTLFPRGWNDARGNWIKARIQRATFGKKPTTRIGAAEIRVLPKVNTLLVIRFTRRLTEEEIANLIQTITFNPPKMGKPE